MIKTAVKPKTAQAKRALKNKDPKTIENTKTAIFLKGSKSSQTINDILADMNALKRPYSVTFSKKNDIHPFEDETNLEFYSMKNDASLFVFGAHSKKRPDHITIGRTFDHKVLDMIELGVENFLPMRSFENSKGCGLGQKPLFVFAGDAFHTSDEFKALKSLILDLYRGESMDQIALNGLEHVIAVTAAPQKPNEPLRANFSVYNIALKKSGSRIPRVELDQEMGPRMDLKLNRLRLPTAEMWKEAIRVPRTIQPKKIKNISKTTIGDKVGRIHLGRQDLGKMQTRKMKGLKRKTASLDDIKDNADKIPRTTE